MKLRDLRCGEWVKKEEGNSRKVLDLDAVPGVNCLLAAEEDVVLGQVLKRNKK